MTKESKDRIWNYLYRENFPSNIEGYKGYQIRLQKQVQTEEMIVSISTGSRFVCFPLIDLDQFIMELITLRTKVRQLIT